MRKATPPFVVPDAPYEIKDDGTWVIYGFEEARQILRSDFVRQSGFASEKILDMAAGIMKNLPILYLEGEEHHQLRRETNRFFTPRTVDRDHRDFMEAFADELVARLQHTKQVDVSDLSMDMAVQVACKIVGLTNSVFAGGLKGRLESIIEVGNKMIADEPQIISYVRSNTHTMLFYFLDVLPAIRERRKNPQHDVISYLIERDYSNIEMLTECIVYGVAGMVTTREFILVALWHLLKNPPLMERMKVGSQEERYAILHEILRLEPVAANLYRRTTDELTFESEGQTITIPANTRLQLHIAAANADERVMGDAPDAICPMREPANIRPKVQEMGLSFGDGAHRCPGAYVAIQESDILLQRLIALPGLPNEREPDVNAFDIAESYELRNFIIAVGE